MKRDRGESLALVGGTVLIGFGLLSLANQLFPNFVRGSFVWPVAVILVGALFFAAMFIGGTTVSGLAIPGSIIGGIGLLLLVQNLTLGWASWSYAWTLIIFLVGLGIFIMGAYGRVERQKKAGLRVMRTGFILFVVFGALFEMIFSIGRPFGVSGLLFPSLLILLGVYQIVQRLGRSGHEKNSTPPPAQTGSPIGDEESVK